MERVEGYILREISEIERDIRKVSDLLNRLVLERKLTIGHIRGMMESSEMLTQHAIMKMKDDKHWEGR